MTTYSKIDMALYIKHDSLQTKLEYFKTDKHHIFSLTHQDLESSKILHQWNLAVLYESTSWLSDVLKIKASKIVPGERVFKVNLKDFATRISQFSGYN